MVIFCDILSQQTSITMTVFRFGYFAKLSLDPNTEYFSWLQFIKLILLCFTLWFIASSLSKPLIFDISLPLMRIISGEREITHPHCTVTTKIHVSRSSAYDRTPHPLSYYRAPLSYNHATPSYNSAPLQITILFHHITALLCQANRKYEIWKSSKLV